ncbi:adenylate/guanylate cyclase domain-containing protein [Leptospira ellisii]|uniref:Adenylate cyclase n=1 Tax=Leptospira ellisii TaxID=2023197 RepID=A0A2N0BLH1_9LEPT|nr:adenylate/guanylate cyclase domain-containing protein [Leptospira ellisii]MDV6236471.1 adenylate/guanylate cyclase domain-containing protein [Leptospira ellisii]PJZ93183.1 adenylate cyclase [Leptospira ellisii]PKA04718.1 adenylate cyclase [Leptospira ellisii]
MLEGMNEIIKKIKSQTMDALAHEILKSEIMRTRILFSYFFFMVSVIGLAFFFLKDRIEREAGIHFPFGTTLAVTLTIAVYEYGVYRLLLSFQKKGKVIFAAGRFANAFVEISFVSVLLWINMNVFESPLIPLFSPAALVYFIFIILSVLRLEFFLSVFTGLVAALEFVALSIYVNPQVQNTISLKFFSSLPPLIGKSATFFITGVIAGFVALQLKRALVASSAAVQEKNQVIGMFGQYVSPDVVDKLLEQKTGNFSESKHVCVMFLDIRNFTRFSEKRSPGEVIDYLNYIFSHLIDIVNVHNGMINKFLGDGFMAVFGAPLSDSGKDVDNAVNASLALLRKIEQLNQEGKIPETQIGIGLHYGAAMTGNIGSEARKEYTIIGDVVNLASRVEQLNKEFGTKLLVTEAVFQTVKDKVPGRHISSLQVKGREEPVVVFELGKV